MERGKFVTRSVYQKVYEENKRLIRDIREMVTGKDLHDGYMTACKWREKFKKEDELSGELTALAKQYLKDHPEYDIMSPAFVKPK